MRFGILFSRWFNFLYKHEKKTMVTTSSTKGRDTFRFFFSISKKRNSKLVSLRCAMKRKNKTGSRKANFFFLTWLRLLRKKSRVDRYHKKESCLIAVFLGQPVDDSRAPSSSALRSRSTSESFPFWFFFFYSLKNQKKRNRPLEKKTRRSKKKWRSIEISRKTRFFLFFFLLCFFFYLFENRKKNAFPVFPGSPTAGQTQHRVASISMKSEKGGRAGEENQTKKKPNKNEAKDRRPARDAARVPETS